ncbi:MULTISPECIES: MFS transporter [unclassified Polaromonas]|uniref:MFS transporter n=1 Tax=unclassified Polaromonas TaxID=2638319 RepID=UPI000F098E67|nr:MULTISPECIES: MFS transporter [unclassified Polaromonas]AYQ27498.1 MFS transporter [Polaromonas sp. SP1]QGJ17662.1 MFS transporter [Polaromonas sp. Pch-P]
MTTADASLQTLPPSPPQAGAEPGRLDAKTGAVVFLAFAAAYFCSALVRAITATLAPVLTQEFSLHARDLGLLAGGYFLGFAATQLPLGTWLDRHGPKRVILCFLAVSVLGCLAFSLSTSFAWLLASRVLVGMGVSACLMAPLTGYRRWYEPATVLRANSWMLMTGSLGMLASTLPVQWLMPLTGWRPLFWILAAMLLLSMAALAWVVPTWQLNKKHESVDAAAPAAADADAGYAPIWRSRYFRKMTPLAFFNYGGLVAVQTLWAGPWMIRVAGYTPLEAATGLFYINATMLATFWSWGMVNPWLARQGWHATRLIAWGTPFSLIVLAVNIAAGTSTGWLGWALFCMGCSVMGLAQPAVGMAFRPSLAGRALSAYNLMIFAGVFTVQWGIGLLIDVFAAMGLAQVASFQAAMGVFLCCCIASYGYFLSVRADNSPEPSNP